MTSSALANLSSEPLGAQLRLARTSLNMTLSDVSKALGLPISTVSDMERGKRRVTSVELFKLAGLYGRSVDFFLKSLQPSTSFNLLLRAVDEQSISKQSILEFRELCSNYGFLKDLLKTSDMSLPPDYSRAQRSLAEAEEIAEAERSALGLDGQPIKDIFDLLESKRGIKIFHLPGKADGFSGAFALDEACGACFLINSRDPARRRTFTVAHEYAHCIAHRNQLAHIDYEQEFEGGNQNERFADAFGAAFLMPKGTVAEVFNQLRSDKGDSTALIIIQLAQYFGVSFEAAGWRLVGLRKLTREKWDDLRGQRIPSTPLARFFGYDVEDKTEPDMLPRQYKYLAYQAYNEHLISFERLAELLHRNFYDLQNELGNAEG